MESRVLDTRTEVIDGQVVTFVKKMGEPIETVRVYDDEGNRFFRNFHNERTAIQEIRYLSQFGIDAIIGEPSAVDVMGERITHEDGVVGLYVTLTPFLDDEFVDSDLHLIGFPQEKIIGHPKLCMIRDILAAEPDKKERVRALVSGEYGPNFYGRK